MEFLSHIAMSYAATDNGKIILIRLYCIELCALGGYNVKHTPPIYIAPFVSKIILFIAHIQHITNIFILYSLKIGQDHRDY